VDVHVGFWVLGQKLGTTGGGDWFGQCPGNSQLDCNVDQQGNDQPSVEVALMVHRNSPQNTAAAQIGTTMYWPMAMINSTVMFFSLAYRLGMVKKMISDQVRISVSPL
jgi:hypothetical protein